MKRCGSTSLSSKTELRTEGRAPVTEQRRFGAHDHLAVPRPASDPEDENVGHIAYPELARAVGGERPVHGPAGSAAALLGRVVNTRFVFRTPRTLVKFRVIFTGHRSSNLV